MGSTVLVSLTWCFMRLSKVIKRETFNFPKLFGKKKESLPEFAIGRNTRETKALISNEFQ